MIPRHHLNLPCPNLTPQKLENTELIEELLKSAASNGLGYAGKETIVVFPVDSSSPRHWGHPFFLGRFTSTNLSIDVETIPALGILLFSAFTESPWTDTDQDIVQSHIFRLFGSSPPEAAQA